jgi:hypothetical protein
VEILEHLEELSEDTFHFILFQSLVKLGLAFLCSLLLEVVVQTPPLDILHDNVDIVVSLKCFNKVNAVLVSELLHQHHFSADAAPPVLVDQL